MAPIRLALVDDHKMLLGALTEWIRSAADDINMVTAVSSWPELLTSPEFPVDVVLLDVDLKDNIPISLKISTLKTTGVVNPKGDRAFDEDEDCAPPEAQPVRIHRDD